MITIVGLDVEQGLKTTGNDTALYLRLLKTFTHTQKDFTKIFDAAWHAQDYQTAEREAHTLKGMAGTIGAEDLYEVSMALEMACRQMQPTEEILELLGHVNICLEPLLIGVSQILPTERELVYGEEDEPLETAAVLMRIQSVIALLDDADTAADEAYAELEAFPGMAAYQDQLQHIRELMDAYRYEEALDALTALKDTVEFS